MVLESEEFTMVEKQIHKLVQYAVQKGWIKQEDMIWATNRVLEIIGSDSFEVCNTSEISGPIDDLALQTILDDLCDFALQTGALTENSIVYRDLFDTKLMGALVPMPSWVQDTFWSLYQQNPKQATDWYYTFSKDTNYIRRDRIQKDVKWIAPTPYGNLDITINLSKPEKDPKAIAMAKHMKQTSYPKCLLCKENEGYAGRVNHPVRQNHRIIPIKINNSNWFLQYSPYVYYNEHCIVFHSEHTPMSINSNTFRKLLDFVKIFPHYFVGSNADLPIAGGSILSHDHFQGGHYTFAMEQAPIETPVTFDGFETVTAGIVKWPMSVLRLCSTNDTELVSLATKILTAWRGYTDVDAFIFAETEQEPHNTITPIARKRGEFFELDLVLRNNITTAEHPLGVYHPHEELHHIKKENIGLIEVMGLAILPARLKEELSILADALVTGADIHADERIEKHADWAETLQHKYVFTTDNVIDILQKEIGIVFAEILEHAGVYKRTSAGKASFLKFIKFVNQI